MRSDDALSTRIARRDFEPSAPKLETKRRSTRILVKNGAAATKRCFSYLALTTEFPYSLCVSS